jgi:hypothetical protein
MALPPSFKAQGFVTPGQTRQKLKLPNGQYLKPLLIGTEGMTDTGKTEWALSAPGVIQMISVDRNFSGVFDNPHPPASRNPNVAIKVCQVPLVGTAKLTDYQKYFNEVKDSFYVSLSNPDSQVVLVDGDSDYWELHVLAHFAKLTQIFPQVRWAAPYAEKRAQIARAWDSGKIVICTNKVKDAYETVYKADGTPEKDSTGEDLRRKTGEHERQGFKDQDYLYNIQLRHLYSPPTQRKMGTKVVDVPGQYGIKILKCKHSMEMVGEELWGSDCTFRGLVDLVYPDVPPQRWGFDA